MPKKCPICGDLVPDLYTHLENAFAHKNPDAPMRYFDGRGDQRWKPIRSKDEEVKNRR